MDFTGFLGNEGLKERLAGAVAAGRLSHSYLLIGPEGSGKHTLAWLLAAAAQCTAEQNRPCRRCEACRKVFAGTHPDVITVDEPEKRGVRVEVARWAKTDLYVRPNEGRRKIYLFPRAQELLPASQNALLKVMEEPPDYGMFLLLTDRAERLLPTVRSRCVELNLSPVGEAEALPFLRRQFPRAEEAALQTALRRSGGFLGKSCALLRDRTQTDERAELLAAAYADGDGLSLTRTLCKLEKLKREQLLPVLEHLQGLLAEALLAKSAQPVFRDAARRLAEKRTAAALLQGVKTVQQAYEAANANVGVGHICGFLAVSLR